MKLSNESLKFIIDGVKWLREIYQNFSKNTFLIQFLYLFFQLRALSHIVLSILLNRLIENKADIFLYVLLFDFE